MRLPTTRAACWWPSDTTTRPPVRPSATLRWPLPPRARSRLAARRSQKPRPRACISGTVGRANQMGPLTPADQDGVRPSETSSSVAQIRVGPKLWQKPGVVGLDASGGDSRRRTVTAVGRGVDGETPDIVGRSACMGRGLWRSRSSFGARGTRSSGRSCARGSRSWCARWRSTIGRCRGMWSGSFRRTLGAGTLQRGSPGWSVKTASTTGWCCSPARRAASARRARVVEWRSGRRTSWTG